MAITWADILTWTTGPLESAATDLAATSKALVSAASEGQDATNGIQSQGSAVTAIRTAASTNMTSLAQLATNVNSALMAIEGAYDGVAKVMANVQNAQAYAAENYCTIGSDGKVSSNAYNEDEETKQRAFLAADSLQKTVNQIIKDADQVDTDLYHAMSDINNDRATDGDKATDNKVIGVPDHPNKNWTPSQNAAWWSSLSEKQRQHLIDHCPDEIRHLDGLPAAARDQANRHALKGWVDANGDEHKGALEYARGKLKEARDKSASEEEIEQLKEKVSDLEAIDRQINNDDRARKGLAPAYLLDFDYDEKYHRTTAIVSSGNPDTASYVSTLVPGIGTHVGSDLKKYMDDNENLKAQTAHTGVDPSRVATISYLGYVAPEGPGGKIYQAANIGYADRAAPDLARFEEGLRASGNANGHSFTNTVIGHSYGSTTAGKAMTQVAEGTVDNFIMCGSPGSGAESIDQYNVPKGHVYESSIPEGDAVQGLGPDSEYGTNPKKLDGIVHLSGDATDADGYWSWTDSLRRTAGILPFLKMDIDLHSFANHTRYFDDGTRTSQDFSNIIAGGKQTTDEEWAAIEKERGK
ncbi:alpha/beta hydrolase [Mycobacteroides abscessus subsp. abscessus]|nr:alpha/beta hydrolase [Mycobacteroides abscessus subsp. abscessus]